MSLRETGGKVLLECSSVALQAMGRVLLEHASTAIHSRTLIHLQGANGVGKSTFLRTLSGELRPANGSIITHLEPKRIFHLPQFYAPDIHLPFSLREVAHLDVVQRRASELQNFDWFPAEMQKLSWNNASGGERMRALLARTLNSDASLLLLDEPFNHLDEQAAPAVLKSFIDFVENDSDRAVVIVSHLPLNTFGLNSYQTWKMVDKKLECSVWTS